MEKNEVAVPENKNIRIYSILAYIGILWIVGLVVKEKDDQTVKFHVGQGMLLSIVGIAVNTVLRIISSVILNVVKFVFGTGVLYVLITIFLFFIAFILSIFLLILMINGIVNASNGKEEELPIIGKYAFYK